MRRGRRPAVRVLRRPRRSRPSAAASSWWRCATRTCRGSTSSSGERAPTACRAWPGSGRTRSPRSSRRPAGSSALHSPEHRDGRLRGRRRRLRARHRGARRRDPPRRRGARADRARGPGRGRRWPTARVVPAAPCRRLRRRVVGPARAGLGCAAGRADRAVPRRVPAARARSGPTSSAARSTRCPTRRCRSSACTSRARSRGERDHRADGAARAHAHVDLRATLRWPGTWRVMRKLVADRRAARSPTPLSHGLLMREAARFVPALGTGDVTAGPRGYRAQAVGRDGALVDDFLVARPGAPCTCSTRRRRPPPRRWRSRS